MFYVHETLHDIGMPDVYRYGYHAVDEIFGGGLAIVPMGEWAVMSAQHGNAREVIAWHRWLLGWLGDEQVYCRPSDSLTGVEVSLSPLTREEKGYKAAMIPVSDRKVIVVESRRAEGTRQLPGTWRSRSTSTGFVSGGRYGIMAPRGYWSTPTTHRL